VKKGRDQRWMKPPTIGGSGGLTPLKWGFDQKMWGNSATKLGLITKKWALTIKELGF